MTTPDLQEPTRDPPGLELDRLADYLAAKAPGLVTPPFKAELIAGGRSNLTYVLKDIYVLRRPPLGHVLATAHDMSREFKVISGLAATPVPVPEALLLCEDDSVLGAPFYLMSRVPGTVYRRIEQTDPLGAEVRRKLAFEMMDTLAALHAVDPAAVGLGDFGRPDGFLERQVRRWAAQLDRSRSRDLAGAGALHDRLAATIPTSTRTAIVHGDFRLDNVLIGDDLRINAVLDWEMSTLGDPLSDVALMLVYAGLPLQVSDGHATVPLEVPGHPTLRDLSSRYADRSGRDVSDLHWYVAFAAFKLAVILEGVHYRYVQGQTVGEGFETIGNLVGPLVMRGHEALEGN